MQFLALAEALTASLEDPDCGCQGDGELMERILSLGELEASADETR